MRTSVLQLFTDDNNTHATVNWSGWIRGTMQHFPISEKKMLYIFKSKDFLLENWI